MIEEVKTYDIERLTKVSRAFTHFLALSNSAENHHRVRKTKIRLMKAKYGLSVKDDSLGGCITRLIADGHSKDDIYNAICSQSVEIVLTGMHITVRIMTIPTYSYIGYYITFRIYKHSASD